MRPRNNPRSARPRLEELDDGEAFVHDSRHGFLPIPDGDAEAFGEEFIAGATSNEAVAEVARDEQSDDDMIGFTLDLDLDVDDEDVFA